MDGEQSKVEQWSANREHDHWAPVDVEPLDRLWRHCDPPPCWVEKKRQPPTLPTRWCLEGAPGNVLSLSPKMLPDDYLTSIPGTFHLVGLILMCFVKLQSRSVHVWMLFRVSSV